MRIAVGILIALLGFGLAAVKVKNELRMTDMYERQALALEHLANVPERWGAPVLARERVFLKTKGSGIIEKDLICNEQISRQTVCTQK